MAAACRRRLRARRRHATTPDACASASSRSSTRCCRCRRESAAATTASGGRSADELAYRETVGAVAATLARDHGPRRRASWWCPAATRASLAVEGRAGSHFPQAPDGRWAGYHPADSDAAIAPPRGAARARGARYLAIPSTSFWWLHHYSELTAHLESTYRRIHSGEHLVVFDLGEPRPRSGRAAGDGAPRAGARPRHLRTRAAGPPTEPGRGARPQPSASRSRSAGSPRRRGAATGRAGDDGRGLDPPRRRRAVLPSGFLDDFLGVASAALGALGVERAQPAHMCGPEAGPPVTERLRGRARARGRGRHAAAGARRCARGAERDGPDRAGRRRADRARRADRRADGTRSATATCSTSSSADDAAAGARRAAQPGRAGAADQRRWSRPTSGPSCSRLPRGLLRADPAGFRLRGRGGRRRLAGPGDRRACSSGFAERLPLTLDPHRARRPQRREEPRAAPRARRPRALLRRRRPAPPPTCWPSTCGARARTPGRRSRSSATPTGTRRSRSRR